MNDTYLSHHGILGQKWGIRRYQNPDGSLTVEGRKRYGYGYGTSRKASNSVARYGAAQKVIEKNAHVKLKEIDHMQEGSTKGELAKLGLSIGLDLLFLNPVGAVMDTQRVVGAIASNSKVKNAEERKANSPIDPKTGYHLKTKEMTADEDVKMVNPGFYNFNSNTKNNCVLCSTAMELRRRGYEVTAGKAGVGYLENEYLKFFKGAKEERYRRDTGTTVSAKDIIFSYKTGKAIKDWAEPKILNQGEGARGYLNIVFGEGGGHSMFYEVKDNKVIAYDPQSGKKTSFKNVCNASVDMGFIRLDTLSPNWPNIKKERAIE